MRILTSMSWNAAKALMKRDLMAAVKSWGPYLTATISFLSSSLMLKTYLGGVGNNNILVASDPLNFPLYISLVVVSFYLAIISAVAISRERDQGTLEVLFYGPVSNTSYVFSKYLADMAIFLFLMGLLVPYFVFVSTLTNLVLSWGLVKGIVLSVFSASCIISFSLLVSTATSKMRNSVILIVALLGGFLSIQLAGGILARFNESSLTPMVQYLRVSINVMSKGIEWVTPFPPSTKVFRPFQPAMSSSISAAYFLHFSIHVFSGCLRRGAAQKRSSGMKHWISLVGIVLLLLFTSQDRVRADLPKYEEQLVYQLRSFNGKGYPETFIPRSEDTIYLLADTNNVISPRVTLVYFWPLAGKFVAAFKQLNEPIEGVLEIFNGQKEIRKIGRSEFVLFYPNGIMGETAQLLQGKDAYGIFKKHEKTLNDFYDKMNEYSTQMLLYRARLQEYAKELEKRKQRGEILNQEQVQAGIPRQPVKPDGPPFDLTGMLSDYVINLPAGNYRIRLRASDGTIVEGSEKKLVTFSRRRVGGVGYEIIPGNRWTKREYCNDPLEIIYGSGENTLYLRPFREDEYNELFYNKLLDPQNRGNPQRWIWVHTAPIENKVLTVHRKGTAPEHIKQTAYLVKQLPGARLGYEILPYTPEKYPDKQPAFESYHVEFSDGNGTGDQTIWLEDGEGRQIPGSVREMSIVKKAGVKWLYLASLFPLMVGLLIYVCRRKATG